MRSICEGSSLVVCHSTFRSPNSSCYAAAQACTFDFDAGFYYLTAHELHITALLLALYGFPGHSIWVVASPIWHLSFLCTTDSNYIN